MESNYTKFLFGTRLAFHKLMPSFIVHQYLVIESSFLPEISKLHPNLISQEDIQFNKKFYITISGGRSENLSENGNNLMEVFISSPKDIEAYLENKFGKDLILPSWKSKFEELDWGDKNPVDLIIKILKYCKNYSKHPIEYSLLDKNCINFIRTLIISCGLVIPEKLIPKFMSGKNSLDKRLFTSNKKLFNMSFTQKELGLIENYSSEELIEFSNSLNNFILNNFTTPQTKFYDQDSISRKLKDFY